MRARLFKRAWVLLCAALFLAAPAYAQGPLSVTVTPPLYQLTIGPGEGWASTLKIVNNNNHEVTYYAEVMNVEAQGEEGQSKFVPILGSDPSSLAAWIDLPQTSIIIPAGSSAELPFTVKIPQDASPGGHYAAILVGTHPPDSEGNNAVKISSYVSSLVFVRIKGDVKEEGRIREFTSEKEWYEHPAAKFILRFENLGNTHLQPQGDITIYNMWGKERGKVLINQKTNFGNVLPKSIRKFEFSWEGEESPLDIGRYSAIATLGYGDEGKQNTTATTYFYVVPVVPVAATLGAIILFILFVVWAIRRYIRRALALERQYYGAPDPARRGRPAQQGSSALDALAGSAETSLFRPVPSASSHSTLTMLAQPIREGVIDLRALAGGAPKDQPQNAPPSEPVSVSKFAFKYKIFFLFIFAIIFGAAAAWWYAQQATVSQRGFQITDVRIGEEPVNPPQTP